MTLTPERFKADVELLQSINFRTLDADAISSFMSSLRPAFRRITEGAQGFVNMVASSPHLSEDPKFLPYIETAVHECIFSINLQRHADFHLEKMDPYDVASLLRVMDPMQAAALRAPILSRETRLCLERLTELSKQNQPDAGLADGA